MIIISNMKYMFELVTRHVLPRTANKEHRYDVIAHTMMFRTLFGACRGWASTSLPPPPPHPTPSVEHLFDARV